MHPGNSADSRCSIFWKSLVLCWLLLLSLSAHADRYEEGGAAYEAGNNVQAFAIWKPLAEEGDPAAQYAIANLYREGLGVKQDLREAAYWMERAAEQGVVLAQLNLGNAFREGYGVQQDDYEAVEWWLLAAGRVMQMRCITSVCITIMDEASTGIRPAPSSGS